MAVAGAGGDDGRMLRGEKFRGQHLLLVQRMALAEHADVLLREEPLLEKPGLQLRQQTDGQVDLPRFHRILEVDGGVAHRADGDLRRILLQPLHEGGKEVDLADVRHTDGEAAFRAGRLEGVAGVDRAVDHAQGIADGLGELLRERRGHHADRSAQKQFIAKLLAQARERIADRRLAQAQVLRDPGNLFLCQQLVEDDQQVEVYVFEFHGGAPKGALGDVTTIDLSDVSH